jgi:ribosomal protein L16 Arg81 hydroxylase
VKPPLTRDALFDLAADYDAESRLITHFRNKWQLAHGPFEPGALPAVSRKAWSLLVQGSTCTSTQRAPCSTASVSFRTRGSTT